MPDTRLRLTVISDYCCPWCYLGLARVERLERDFDIDVDWRPFDLHPETPAEGRELGPRTEYYMRLLPAFAEAGLPFQPSTRVPNTHLALEASEFAREQGAFDAYHRALFEAHFARSEDIGSIETLVRLGGEHGLDTTALREALESRRYAGRIDELTDESRQEGVGGTPTFRFEIGERRLELVGAQQDSLFADVARRLGAQPRGETAATGSGR